jgi:hypothetical protein
MKHKNICWGEKVFSPRIPDVHVVSKVFSNIYPAQLHQRKLFLEGESLCVECVQTQKPPNKQEHKIAPHYSPLGVFEPASLEFPFLFSPL